MSALEQQPDPLGAALERTTLGPAEQGSNGVSVLDARARARSGWAASGTESRTPLGDRLRELVAADPEMITRVYVDALGASRWDKGLGEVPDYAVRIKAAESIANRAEGMPTTRTELTGADGGPVTLAALLCIDVNDSI